MRGLGAVLAVAVLAAACGGAPAAPPVVEAGPVEPLAGPPQQLEAAGSTRGEWCVLSFHIDYLLGSHVPALTREGAVQALLAWVVERQAVLAAMSPEQRVQRLDEGHAFDLLVDPAVELLRELLSEERRVVTHRMGGAERWVVRDELGERGGIVVGPEPMPAGSEHGWAVQSWFMRLPEELCDQYWEVGGRPGWSEPEPVSVPPDDLSGR